MERNLASLQIIKNIRPIEKADRLEKANVEAFQVVIPKGTYHEGELVVFFEADSFLPVEDRYNFLASSLKENEVMGKGYRIKVQKLRGEVTHGLVMPLSDFPEIINATEGLDVTELLNVKKWDMSREEAITGKGSAKPWFVPTTDEIRIQSREKLLNELKGKDYYISTKVDGMSVTMYLKGSEFGITSRKISVPETENNNLWKYAKQNRIEDKIRELNKETGMNYIIQGEFAGPSIQSNNLGLENYKWFIFNVFVGKDDTDMRMLNLNEMIKLADRLSLDTVPIDSVGIGFNMSLEEVLKKANGNYDNGHLKEGIVVRPVEPVFSETLQKELSFKVVNDDYWAQEK